MRVAVATSSCAAAMSKDDPILLAAIERAGHEAVHWCWDDATVDWSLADVLVIRSTWDYFTRPTEFREWLENVAAQTRVLNPPDVLHWNFDKRYLAELERSGIAVVPTQYVTDEGAAQTAIEAVWAEGRTAIVKPVVSGGSWGLLKLEPGDSYTLNPAQAPWMVQPFISEIVSDGELAVIVLGGEVHHGIRKTPAAGEFRVQAEFGGVNTVEEPSPEAQALALTALDACPGEALYARVDLVRRQGRLEVIEVELIEPELFLVLVPEAANRLVSCL